ncbi:hypothetical protein Tco_0593295 [Tanacetum coccineum]
MAKATSSQAMVMASSSISILNVTQSTSLSKKNLVNGLPKLKFIKDHLCSSYELGKAKRKDGENLDKMKENGDAMYFCCVFYSVHRLTGCVQITSVLDLRSSMFTTIRIKRAVSIHVRGTSGGLQFLGGDKLVSSHPKSRICLQCLLVDASLCLFCVLLRTSSMVENSGSTDYGFHLIIPMYYDSKCSHSLSHAIQSIIPYKQDFVGQISLHKDIV